jgi:hypothetical protein
MTFHVDSVLTKRNYIMNESNESLVIKPAPLTPSKKTAAASLLAVAAGLGSGMPRVPKPQYPMGSKLQRHEQTPAPPIPKQYTKGENPGEFIIGEVAYRVGMGGNLIRVTPKISKKDRKKKRINLHEQPSSKNVTENRSEEKEGIVKQSCSCEEAAVHQSPNSEINECGNGTTTGGTSEISPSGETDATGESSI